MGDTTIWSRRDNTADGRESTEIQVRHVMPSRDREHCVEMVVEQAASERRASKHLAIYLTADEALALARSLKDTAQEARGDAGKFMRGGEPG